MQGFTFALALPYARFVLEESFKGASYESFRE